MKKEKQLMNTATDVMKTGVVLGVGSGVLSTLSNQPGMASQTIGKAGQGALNLVGVGMVAKVGMDVAGMTAGMAPRPKKKSGNKVIDNILYG